MCATTIGLAGPAGASTNIASAARDDAADSRADITEVIDTYSDGVAGVGVRVVSPEDPRTAYNWVNGFTFFVWTISTPAGAFDVVYHHFGSELSAEVTKDSGATTVCNATPDFDGTTYTAVFAASCIGHPSSFQVRAFANYDDALAGGGGGLDFAPSLTEFCLHRDGDDHEFGYGSDHQPGWWHGG